MLKNNPDNFRLDYALSREQKNKKGGKMYIQDKVRLAASLRFDLRRGTRRRRGARRDRVSRGAFPMTNLRTGGGIC